MEQLEQAIVLLQQILEDTTVPKNIRESVSEAKEDLEEDVEFSVKLNKSIHVLDEISEDPNMPVYTRTQIWNVVSLLESISK